MNKLPRILVTGAVFWGFLTGCRSLDHSSTVVGSDDYPDRDQDSIVSDWGYPSEVILRKDAGKLGNNVVTWVYYLQDESGEIAPVFYSFRGGKPLATNAFGETSRRVMDVNHVRDLKLILAERERIKKIWRMWD